jgi:hypothetical protein
MPPQKNSGNKKAKRETGIAVKNRKFIADMLYDYRKEGKVEDIYIGRVTRMLGNGRVDVFYVAKEIETVFDKDGDEIEKEVYNSYEKQASIRGSFRGRGKHSVWIGVGTAVAIADCNLKNLNGVDMLEIRAVLTRDQLKEISTEIHVDGRVLNGVQDGENTVEDAIEFDEELNVDQI